MTGSQVDLTLAGVPTVLRVARLAPRASDFTARV